MLDGLIEIHPLPAQPARRAGPADRRPRGHAPRHARSPQLAAMVRGAACFAELSDDLLTNVLDLLSGRYPSEEFSELRPRLVWDRVNGTLRARDGVEAAGRHERRHHPRPRPVRRVPARRHPGGRARRGDGVREPARRDVPARRQHLAHRGHHVRAGRRHARAGPAGQDAVLARRPAGPPARARPGARRVPARDPRAARSDRAGHADGRLLARRARRPTTCCCTSTSRPRPPAWCPTIARSWSSGSATRSATGGCASSARSARPVHAPWAMAIERRLIERYDIPVETMWSDDGIVLRLPEAADELPLDELIIDPDDIDELVHGLAAADVAVLGPVPRVRGPGAAAAAPPARSAHAAVAAAPARRRPAGRRLEVPHLPDPARDVARVPAGRVRPAGAARGARPAAQPGHPRGQRRHRQGVAVRAEPAVQLDRRVHVRGRQPAGRAPGRGARARPRPAARPARCRGAARAARPRRARRPRAGAAVLTDGRRARSADELHDVLRKVGDLTAAEVDLRCEGTDVGRVAGRSWCTSGGPSRCRSPARRATSPPRMRPATATRSAARAARPAAGVHRAGAAPARVAGRPLRRAPTGRSSSTMSPAASASPSTVRWARSPRSRPTTGWCAASSGPTAVGREWCDVDVLRQLRRRSLAALRREVEPVEQRGLRALPARRGTASPASGAASRRWSRRSASCRARRWWPARSRPRCCRCGCAATAPPTSTSCAPSANWCGWAPARSAPPTVGCGCTSPTSCPLLAPALGAARPPTGALHDAIRAHLAAHGASFWNGIRCATAVGDAASATDAEMLTALWDLVWAGEVTNDSLAPLRSLLGGKGTKARARPRRARPAAPGPAHPHRPAARRRPVEPGRTAAAAGAVAHRGRAHHRAAAARALRRGHPRGRAGRGRARRLRSRCTAC